MGHKKTEEAQKIYNSNHNNNIMKIFAFFSLLSTASAFVPISSNTKAHSTTIARKLYEVRAKDLVGYYTNSDDSRLEDKLPGDWGFDPFGFSETQGGLFFQREAEIKHARLAMLVSRQCSIVLPR